MSSYYSHISEAKPYWLSPDVAALVRSYPPVLISRVLKYAGLADTQGPRAQALDLGCGPGQVSVALAQTGKFAGVTAVDPSKGMVSNGIQPANGNVKIDYQIGFSDELPSVPDKSVDLVTAGTAILFRTSTRENILIKSRYVRPSSSLVQSSEDFQRASQGLETRWCNCLLCEAKVSISRYFGAFDLWLKLDLSGIRRVLLTWVPSPELCHI